MRKYWFLSALHIPDYPSLLTVEQRCGKRQHMEVPERFKDSALKFARRATGCNDSNAGAGLNPLSGGPSCPPSISLSQSSSSVGKSSSDEAETFSTDPSSFEPSVSSFEASGIPQVSADTKKYMLLCVNSNKRLIQLANVDVTGMKSDKAVFDQLRSNYANLRGIKARNPFFKPTTMHYIEV